MDGIKPTEPVDQHVNKQVEDEFVGKSRCGIKPDQIIHDYFDPKYQEARAASNKKDQQDGNRKLTIGGNLGTKKLIKDHAKNILKYQHAGGETAAEADDYDIVGSSEYQRGGSAVAAKMDVYDVVETSEYQHAGHTSAAEMDGYDVVETSEYQHAGHTSAAEMDGYDVVETSECQRAGSIAPGEDDGDVFIDALSSFTPAGSEDGYQSED